MQTLAYEGNLINFDRTSVMSQGWITFRERIGQSQLPAQIGKIHKATIVKD